MTYEVWDQVCLRNLCELVQYGYTASATEKDIGPKFLRITDIVPPLIDWSKVPYCTIEPSKADKYLLKDGDIVVARTGATTGYAKQLNNPPRSVFASYLVRLRVKGDVDPTYVGAVVQSSDYKRFIMANIGGAAQPSANAQVLTSYLISLPPLPIQRRIASILSAYDDLIENNTRRIAILEEMARRLYEEWFVHFRFPGHEDVKMVESEIGEMPEEWEISCLADLAEIVMGQSPKSEFYNEIGEGLPFHQGVTNFGEHFPTNRLYCTIENRIAEAGDILFSVRAPVGRINTATTKMVVGRGLSAIRSKIQQQTFLLCQLRSKFSEEDMIGGGTIFKAVTKEDMHDIQLVKPPADLVEKFEQYAFPQSNLIRALTDKNANLRAQRDLLLPKLVSGEIDVSEVGEQMAEAAAE